MPTGHLYTFEFNERRVVQAKEEFSLIGLKDCITVTHRDVCENGFEIEGVDI